LTEEEHQLTKIRDTQESLDDLNEKASEEILAVERKFNKLRVPLFGKRQETIRQLDKQSNTKFWWTSFQRHPMLFPMLSPEEEGIMSHLDEIEVNDNDDIKSGYEIKFHFAKNPYFTNKTLTKGFYVKDTGIVENQSPTIEWKTGKNLFENEKNKPKKKAEEEEDSEDDTEHEFFAWLIRNHEEATDEVADIIKDDLWSNPYQYFMGQEESSDEDLEEIDEEGEDEE